ncbi:hypothetical protein R3P38DRAFT_2798469 [Favolaschia claudopus]|uniref:Uncharacterized protein n=1 Tax=Favolaschia claudopus TaxID=2862362 RepID=A0AAW0A296_9AGAR
MLGTSQRSYTWEVPPAKGGPEKWGWEVPYTLLHVDFGLHSIDQLENALLEPVSGPFCLIVAVFYSYDFLLFFSEYYRHFSPEWQTGLIRYIMTHRTVATGNPILLTWDIPIQTTGDPIATGSPTSFMWDITSIICHHHLDVAVFYWTRLLRELSPGTFKSRHQAEHCEEQDENDHTSNQEDPANENKESDVYDDLVVLDENSLFAPNEPEEEPAIKRRSLLFDDIFHRPPSLKRMNAWDLFTMYEKHAIPKSKTSYKKYHKFAPEHPQYLTHCMTCCT